MSMAKVRKVVEATANNGEAITTLCRLVLDETTEAPKAMYAAWVLTHLSPADKQEFVLPFCDAFTDKILSGTLPFRPGLLLSLLYDLAPETTMQRADLLDFCLHGITDGAQHDSCRSLMIKLAARMARPFPELLAELHETLLLLPPGLPPSIECAKRKVMNPTPKRPRKNSPTGLPGQN